MEIRKEVTALFHMGNNTWDLFIDDQEVDNPNLTSKFAHISSVDSMEDGYTVMKPRTTLIIVHMLHTIFGLDAKCKIEYESEL